MIIQSKPMVLFLLVGVFVFTGCNFGQFAGKQRAPRERKLTVKQQIKVARAELPKEVDEYTTLVKIEEDPSGSLDFWYELTDKGTELCRKYGRERLREAANQMVGTHEGALDFANTGKAIHHIYESKFGTHMLSFTVSPQSIEGRETIGQPQANPFAVKNVSLNGDQ